MQKLKSMIDKYPHLKSEKSEYLKLAVKDENGVVRGTGPHRVKVVGCENAVSRDYKTQKEVKGVNLIFEENGERKKYFVPTLGEDGKFHYLIERFAEIEEGTEVIMEYKRKEGSVRGFIDVQVVGKEEQKVEDTITEDDIPIVEEEDYGTSEEDIGAENFEEVAGEEQV